MKFRLALGGLICLGLMSSSAFAVTAETKPAAPTADTQEDTTATEPTDANAAPTDTDQNPYTAIVRANVFQLKEPPPPPKRDDPAILNLPKVNMTGFRKRDGEAMRALFATVPKDTKEPPSYFNLAEGEKDGILEVKHIDPNQQFVDVIIAGTPTTLTISNNSFVQQPPKAAPGNPAIVGARPPQPTAPPVAAPAYNNAAYNNNNHPGGGGGGVIIAGGGGNTATPGASVTTIGGNNGNAPSAAYNPGAGVAVGGGTIAPAGGDSALRSIPTRGIRTPNYTPGQYQPQSLPEAQAHAYLYNTVNQPQIQSGELPPGPPLPQ